MPTVALLILLLAVVIKAAWVQGFPAGRVAGPDDQPQELMFRDKENYFHI